MLWQTPSTTRKLCHKLTRFFWSYWMCWSNKQLGNSQRLKGQSLKRWSPFMFTRETSSTIWWVNFNIMNAEEDMISDVLSCTVILSEQHTLSCPFPSTKLFENWIWGKDAIWAFIIRLFIFFFFSCASQNMYRLLFSVACTSRRRQTLSGWNKFDSILARTPTGVWYP